MNSNKEGAVIMKFKTEIGKSEMIKRLRSRLGPCLVIAQTQNKAQEPDEFPGCPEGCTCEGEC